MKKLLGGKLVISLAFPGHEPVCNVACISLSRLPTVRGRFLIWFWEGRELLW